MRRRKLLVALAGLAVVLAVALFAYSALAPASRVLIVVRHVPPDTRFVCLVAETPQGPLPLPWSLWKVGPFEMHPADCIVSMHQPGDSMHQPGDPVRGDNFCGPVHWHDADRYGLVTGDQQGRWRVRWLRREDLHVRGRSWLLGGGEGTIDLSGAPEAEVAADEFWDGIGLPRDTRLRWQRTW
jgi:hypothetical protein